MGDVGFRGPDYSGASAPTGQKPQSKLWVVGDAWFASMYNALTGDFEIHRLDSATHTWSSTGTLIDERAASAADVLLDGGRLYVVSASTSTTTAGAVRIRRYSYNSASKTFVLDAGFPVPIHNGTLQAVVMDKDTTGRLWVTFTESRRVYVMHSTADDRTWASPFVLPVGGASNLTAADISSVVAYNGKTGVMWSNQTESAMHFAYHRDGAPVSTWTRNTAVQQANYADDHINLKALNGDPSGQVFAATKTSLNDVGRSGPLILLMVLGNDDVWRRYTVGAVPDNHTRPIVAIDRQNRQIYELASAPCCSGGAIYYKQTSLDSPTFSAGLGTPFLQSSTDVNINNPTSTKQELNGVTDLVALASDDHTRNYWHNRLDLPGGRGVPPGPTGTALPIDRTRPVIRALKLRPRAFRAKLRVRRAAAGRRAGSVVSYRLSEHARVRFRIERAATGRNVGRRCVRPTPRNRRNKTCRRYRRLRGGFSHAGVRGANRFRFNGRLRGRPLRRGRYRLVAVPIDRAHNRGKAARAPFRITGSTGLRRR